MKKNTKSLSKSLLKYGALSAAIAGVADASGQVVYTDVNPDEVLAPGMDYLFDLNNDGTIDFQLSVIAAGTASSIAIAGIYPANGTSLNSNGMVGFNAGAYYYPSNLAAGVTVDGASPVFSSVPGTLNVNSCAYTNSQFCGGVTDGYIGLVLKVGADTHYGWVRIDLSADASSMTIKDFAYESTPGTAIVTGNLAIDEAKIGGFDYFVAGGNLNITANEPMQEIALFDLLGKKTISRELGTSNASVDLSSLNSGIYIAKVIGIDGTAKSFKIVKE